MENKIWTALFATYKYMNEREKLNFKHFICSKSNSENIMELVKFMGLELIIVEDDRMILSTYKFNINNNPVTNYNSTKEEKEHLRFNKKMDTTLRKKDQESRFRSFMKTGLRGDIKKKQIQVSSSFDIIVKNKLNVQKSWSRLSLWHKKKAIQKYIKTLDKNDDNIKILSSLDDQGINNMAEPEYNIRKSTIISLTKKKVQSNNHSYKSKKLNALQLLKKQRQRRKDLENKSVTFQGDFVAENI